MWFSMCLSKAAFECAFQRHPFNASFKGTMPFKSYKKLDRKNFSNNTLASAMHEFKRLKRDQDLLTQILLKDFIDYLC